MAYDEMFLIKGYQLVNQISKEQGDYILSHIDPDNDYFPIESEGKIYCTDIAEEPEVLDRSDGCVHAIFTPNEQGYEVYTRETFMVYLTKKFLGR